MKQRKGLKEVKAERAERKKRARRRKRMLVLFAELFILFTLLGVGYVMSKYGKIQLNILEDEEIIMNEGIKKEGYTTIALFGGDSREGHLEEGAHADTIMLVSINNKNKEVKVISVYRDLLTWQMSGETNKANYAYFKGGPQEAINMLNMNLDLNITDYVTLGWGAVVDSINLLGGLDIEIESEEIKGLNECIQETAIVTENKANYINNAGLLHLDGVQATSYCRLRSTAGSDYRRTERQRLVIQKLTEKVQNTDLTTLNKIIDKVFPQISTSFTLKELLSLAAGALQYKLGETSGFAFEYTDGSVEGLGSVVIPLGLVENVQELHAFLYPNEEYTPSDTVRQIANEIEELTGYTRADYQEPNATTGPDDTTTEPEGTTSEPEE